MQNDKINPMTEMNMSQAARELGYRSVCVIHKLFINGEIPGARKCGAEGKIGVQVAIPIAWVIEQKEKQLHGNQLQRGNTKNSSKLNQRQEKFCHEYLIDLCADAAAVRAGYCSTASYWQANRLMENKLIQKRIAELKYDA